MPSRVLIVMAVCAGLACARPRGSGAEVALVDLGPSELDFEDAFADRLVNEMSSVSCRGAPPQAVLEGSSSSARYLGFCDGRIIQQPRAGGLIVSTARGRLPTAQAPGWELRRFGLGDLVIGTDVPRRAEVRVRSAPGGAVRLVGKGFDTHVALAEDDDGGPLTPPAGCALVESTEDYVICRRSDGGHRLIARAHIDTRVVRVESHPGLRATLRQAEEMLTAVQLMHRLGRRR